MEDVQERLEEFKKIYNKKVKTSNDPYYKTPEKNFSFAITNNNVIEIWEADKTSSQIQKELKCLYVPIIEEKIILVPEEEPVSNFSFLSKVIESSLNANFKCIELENIKFDLNSDDLSVYYFKAKKYHSSLGFLYESITLENLFLFINSLCYKTKETYKIRDYLRQINFKKTSSIPIVEKETDELLKQARKNSLMLKGIDEDSSNRVVLIHAGKYLDDFFVNENHKYTDDDKINADIKKHKK